MATTTFQRADLGWTAADDDAVRELLLEASCYSSQQLEPLTTSESPRDNDTKPSVFNRPTYCEHPRGVDEVTGEITSWDSLGRPSACRSRLCEWCAKTEAIKMAFRVMRVRPPLEFGLTDIGQTPEDFSKKLKRLVRLLRKLGEFEYWLAVEISSNNYGHVHVHGYARGLEGVTQAQFQAVAAKAGFGRSKLSKVPTLRRGLAQHYAYPMKSLDSPDPVVKAEYLRWNAKGSRIGFESHSRNFFRDHDQRNQDDDQEAYEDSLTLPADGSESPPELTKLIVETDTPTSNLNGSQRRTAALFRSFRPSVLIAQIKRCVRPKKFHGVYFVPP